MAELASIKTLNDINNITKLLGTNKKEYFWVGAVRQWSWSVRNNKYIWKHETGLEVRECGSYSVDKFGLRGDCERKRPYICMREDKVDLHTQ